MNLSNVAEIKTTYINKIPASERTKIIGSRQAYDYLCSIPNYWENLDYIECFYAIFLTRSNHALCYKLISQGGTSGTIVDPKLVFQNALKVNASSIILSHNHPSGNVKPSENDIKITNKLIEAGKFLDIPILDHIVMARDVYSSFADVGFI